MKVQFRVWFDGKWYSVQKRYLLFPFWMTCTDILNTHFLSEDRAIELMRELVEESSTVSKEIIRSEWT